MYDLGDTVTLGTSLVEPVSGQPIDSTGVQVTITLPDGTTAVLSGGTILHPAVGTYSTTYVPTVAGLHRYNWTGTAPAFGETGTFTVWPPLSVLSLDDAKQHLNFKASDQDEELRGTIMAATAAIESWCGPLTPTQTTSRVRSYSGGFPARAAYDGAQGYASSLVLPVTPVIDLVSVTPLGGVPLDISGLFVSPAGVVDAAISSMMTGRFYDVTYIAGRTSVPADLYQALLELTRHLWQTQRGGSSNASSKSSSQPSVPGSAYAFPYRVEQLMQPYVQIGIG